MSQQPTQQPPTQGQVQQPPTQGQVQQSQFGQVGQRSQKELQGTFGQGFTQEAPLPIQDLVKDLDTFENVSEWAHSKAMQKGDPTLATYTNDLAKLAEVQKKLLQSRSPFAEVYANCTSQAIQQSLQQLQQYAQDPDVQDVVQHAQRIASTIDQAFPEISRWTQQGLGGAQQLGQQGIGQQSMAQQVPPGGQQY